MFGKRGLSSLVATVLIVLLALAAVAIIWGFLKPAFDRGGQQIDLGSQCFSMQLDVESCTLDATASTATLIVKLNSEKSPLFTEMIGVFEEDTGVTHIVTENVAANLPGTLETKAISYDWSVSGIQPTKARVAAVLVDGTNRKACTESRTITCA